MDPDVLKSSELPDVPEELWKPFGPERPQAEMNLGRLSARLSEVPEGRKLLLELLRRSAESPAPSQTLNNVERFFGALELPQPIVALLRAEANALNALFALFGYSQFLSEVLIRHPEFLFWLSDPGVLLEARPPSAFRREIWAVTERHTDRNQLRDALCRLRRREMLRIGARDVLGLATAEEVSRELSDLAEVIISAAAHHARQAAVRRFGHPFPETATAESLDTAASDVTLRDGAEPLSANGQLPLSAGMCVFGMGKLGGRELNFSSDIDLIFIYEAEGITSGRMEGGRRVGSVSNHLFFARVGEDLVRFLSERGPEGNLYRVDMRLRPEGADGPLVRSLDSFVAYLKEQARDWERVAYLKARVMSGPAHLAERLYRVTDQFVFSDVEPKRIIREIEALKLRIDREVVQSDAYERDVKRGYGGIREIEFVVAAMQIIYGKAHRALHVRNFFVAIQRLREVGLLTPEEMEFYENAYAFLRTVEHRLQMAEEHQTHTFPPGGGALDIVARQCGFLGAEQFLSAYRRVSEGVHQRFVRFFEMDVTQVNRTTRDLITILDRSADPAEAQAALARQGVHDPAALRLVHDLAYGTREVFVSAGGQRCFEEMLPSLLRLIASTPRPDRVLPHLHSFMHTIKGMTYYYEVIAHHPDILKLLVTLFGTSDVLSQSMISRPEFFDALISTMVLHEPEGTVEGPRERLSAALAPRTMNRRLFTLRRAVQFEVLLTALRFLLDLRPLRSCLQTLSLVADLTVATGMTLASQKLAERAGLDPTRLESLARRHFAVLALGKYGGKELNFFGDLDVVFVYQRPSDEELYELLAGRNAAEFFAELSDALVLALGENLQGGRAFVLDARLRPYGAGSPIATELTAYTSYLETEAAVWELQAFGRARTVWGNTSLEQTLKEAFTRRHGQLSRHLVKQEVISMRRRLAESAAGQPDEQIEFKRSAGGIVDAEFILQYLALTGKLPLHSANTSYFAQLDQLPEMLEEPARQAAVQMRHAYTVLRRLETACRLIAGESRSTLSSDSYAPAIARILGFAGADASSALRSAIAEVMTSMRSSYYTILDSC